MCSHERGTCKNPEKEQLTWPIQPGKTGIRGGRGMENPHTKVWHTLVRIQLAPPQTNPYTMKHFLQENLIYLPFALMVIIVLLFAGWALYEFAKKEKPVLSDDLPGHYEDYEVSERPFIEYFN